MGESTLWTGKKGNNTGEELSSNRMPRVEKENGSTAEELNGWTKQWKELTSEFFHLYIYI